jgi:hypothetical protein
VKRIIIALVALLVFSSQSFAHTLHHHHHRHVVAKAVPQCVFFCPQTRTAAYIPIKHTVPVVRKQRHTLVQYADNKQQLPHPEGCPRTAFCGCGASMEAFGHNVRSLWLAANWYRFPRTSPAPGMAIVRPHHVAILKSHIEGSVWMVVDHNGGGHRSWLHARNISGYTVVNPHG